MIPSTAASLLAFLGLVAPGLVFQLRREHYVPRTEQTPFREVSYVALVSLVCSAGSLMLLALVARWHPTWLPDIAKWATTNHYAGDHWTLVGFAGFPEVVLVCGFAIGIAQLFTKEGPKGDLHDYSAWWDAIRGQPPEDNEFIYVTVWMRNGARYAGHLMGYTAEDVPVAEREITLCHPRLSVRRAPNADETALDGELCVVVHGADIESLSVKHPPLEGAD